MLELESRIIEAMKAAGYYFDEINSYDGGIFFNNEYVHLYFESVDEIIAWLDGVVFDDPEISDNVEKIMHPERFS